MYTPKHFVLERLDLLRQLIDEHPFALLIGPDAQGRVAATHLPMYWAEGEDGSWWLEGHVARANSQALALAAAAEVLLVINGPQAYVSPQHYEHERNVPTWNYLSAHLHGPLSLIDEPTAKDDLLKRQIARHEPAYAQQWRGLPASYQQQLLGAIVGLRLSVRHWEAKTKLSQNRSALERERIRSRMAQGTAQEQGLAIWMQRLGL